MVKADRFVFVHIPRTGGTWVRELIRQHAPKQWRAEISLNPEHVGVREIELRGRFAFAFIRNPWDWHVSRLFFWRQNLEPARFAALFQQHGTAFGEMLKALLDDGDTLDSRITNATSADVVFGRFEMLRQELERLLHEAGHELPPPMLEAIRSSPPRNGVARASYRTFYNAELRDLVAKAEAHMIERFGYEF